MGLYDWDSGKNDRLMRERGVSFEEVVFRIENGYLLAVIENPNQRRYSGQKAFVVEMRGYAYLVPFVERGGTVFLKTVIPTRKLTRRYLGKGRKDAEA